MPQSKLFFKSKTDKNGKTYYEAFNRYVGKVLLFEADSDKGIEWTANVIKKYTPRPYARNYSRPYSRPYRSNGYNSYARRGYGNRRYSTARRY